MKNPHDKLWKKNSLAVLFLVFSSFAFGQGRVVINEYMPWTPSGCGVTSEFVELMNFGPGPVDISCYVLTDGDYAIVIPPNTLLQVGEYYLIAGQDILFYPCGNIDSTVSVDLNWNTCGCTTGAIPISGDGFLTDGGSANEQLVLMNPALEVVDAVARALPVETSTTIFLATAGGSCGSGQFNLDSITINYETIGESAGRGNSFARKLDGDCGWVKDPQQSANATNNTPGDESDVSYKLTITEAMACPYGSVSIAVTAASYANVFPMTYTLAYDSNKNGLFDLADYYSVGTDNTPNTITIGNLPAGLYRITLATVKGCNLSTIEFRILQCFPVLSSHLLAFKASLSPGQKYLASWIVTNHELLTGMELQQGRDMSNLARTPIPLKPNSPGEISYQYELSQPGIRFIRLTLYGPDSIRTDSPVIDLKQGSAPAFKIWPNPTADQLNIALTESHPMLKSSIFHMDGRLAQELTHLYPGTKVSINIQKLSAGIYFLNLTNFHTGQSIGRVRFVKN